MFNYISTFFLTFFSTDTLFEILKEKAILGDQKARDIVYSYLDHLEEAPIDDLIKTNLIKINNQAILLVNEDQKKLMLECTTEAFDINFDLIEQGFIGSWKGYPVKLQR